MRANTRRFALVLFAALGAVLSGCGDAKSKATYADVEGTVTWNGKPVAGAEVTFYPITDGTEALPSATTRTDDTGKYRLAGGGTKTGAVVGKHRVVVAWPARERNEDQGSSRLNPFEIPVRYTVAGQTPLQVEVKAPGPNTIDLKLDPR